MLLEHFLKPRFVLCLKFGPGASFQVKNKRLSSSWPTGSCLTTGLLSSPCPQQLSVSHHFTPPGFSFLPAVVFFLPVPAPESFLGNVHIPARGLVTPSLELRPLSHCCAQEELLLHWASPGAALGLPFCVTGTQRCNGTQSVLCKFQMLAEGQKSTS